MTNYKLMYFNAKGAVETSRYLFALSGTKYEDFRVEGEEWQKLKPNMILGQLPVLEIDGKQLPQTNTINRYLAKKFGYFGSDDLEAAFIDAVIETLAELLSNAGAIFREQDETKKAEMLKTYHTETVIPNAAKLEKLLKLNEGGDGFFVGKKVSLADVRFFHLYHDMLPAFMKTEVDLSQAPKLQALIGRVKEIPEIDAWIKNRPVTNM